MKAAGINPYDYNIKLDLNLTLDVGALLEGIDLSKVLSIGKSTAKSIIKKAPKSGTKAKEKAGAAAPIGDSEAVSAATTDNQEATVDTSDPKEKE